jgi:hypothetical protein
MLSSPVLLGRYPSDKAEADRVKAMLPSLSAPAKPQQVAQMVAVLLNMYFVVDQRSEVFKGIASRWLAELEDFPEWAIDRAVTWWIGRDNPKRDRRPMPGDIAARAKREMGHINAARQQIKFFEKYGDNPPDFVKRMAGVAQN